jgi:predicted DNA-binding transcriptional regulator AlpA
MRTKKLKSIKCKICLRAIEGADFILSGLCEVCAPVQEGIDALIHHIRVAAVQAELSIQAPLKDAAPETTETTVKPEILRELLSKADVAAMLGVSPKTVDRMEERGELPIRLNVSTNVVRWKRSEIADFIESRKRGIGQYTA